MQVNEATGEVTETLAGETFRFHATLPRVAALQAAIGENSLSAIFAGINRQDAKVIYEGLRCLCSSDNAAKIDDLVLGRVLTEAGQVIASTLAAGIPQDDPPKNGDAAGAKATT
jgi:hypothetical protein